MQARKMAQILEEQKSIKQQLAQEKLVQETVSFLQFTFEGSRYLSPIQSVQEVLEIIPVAKYPIKVNGHVGVINIRGRIVPVIAHKEQLVTQADKMIILILNEACVAIRVSQVKKIKMSTNEFETRLNNKHGIVQLSDGPAEIWSEKHFNTQKECA